MNKKEITSLIRLLDDPDQEIFQHVEARLVTLGSQVIGQLESEWEDSFDALQQARIENLIHKIQFQSVKRDLEIWKLTGGTDLLNGLLIINRYQYPDKDSQQVIEKIDRMVELAQSQYSLDNEAAENVRILNQVLFTDFRLSGNTSNYHDPQNSYIGQVLESGKGNPILLAAIYSIVAQRLGLPIYGVNLPKHFILAYTEANELILDRDQILFYINAFNRGQIFGRHDVVSFLRQLSLDLNPQFILPCDNFAIITRVLRNLSSAYSQMGNQEKKEEIELLLSTLTD